MVMKWMKIEIKFIFSIIKPYDLISSSSLTERIGGVEVRKKKLIALWRKWEKSNINNKKVFHNEECHTDDATALN